MAKIESLLAVAGERGWNMSSVHAGLNDLYKSGLCDQYEFGIATKINMGILQRLRNEDGCTMFVAIDESSELFVGAAELHTTETMTSSVGTLYNVIVRPSYRRQGIARLMLMRIIEHARIRWNISRIRLDTTREALPAQDLYESLGFERDKNFHYTLSL